MVQPVQRPRPRLHRLPQRLDYTLIPAPLDLSLTKMAEKSPLPAIIVTPSSPPPTHNFQIAFLPPPPTPTLKERVSSLSSAVTPNVNVHLNVPSSLNAFFRKLSSTLSSASSRPNPKSPFHATSFSTSFFRFRGGRDSNGGSTRRRRNTIDTDDDEVQGLGQGVILGQDQQFHRHQQGPLGAGAGAGAGEVKNPFSPLLSAIQHQAKSTLAFFFVFLVLVCHVVSYRLGAANKPRLEFALPSAHVNVNANVHVAASGSKYGVGGLVRGDGHGVAVAMGALSVPEVGVDKVESGGGGGTIWSNLFNFRELVGSSSSGGSSSGSEEFVVVEESSSTTTTEDGDTVVLDTQSQDQTLPEEDSSPSPPPSSSSSSSGTQTRSYPHQRPRPRHSAPRSRRSQLLNRLQKTQL
ncbi:hypothetical protein AX16_007566 [Volvariella volvacea WC 439]|nr:hypothetical protein AX16_007566 [Volvariella volvacea WC 439]